MAIVAQNGQDDNQQNQSNMGGSGTITGSPGMATGGGGGSSAYQAPAAPRGNPSGTPNIQDYLNANQGAGQRIAGSITGNVQNQANQVNQQYNTSQQQLGNLYQPLNQSLSSGQQSANTAFQNPQDLLAAYQSSQQQANPTPGTTPAAPNQQNLSAYNSFQADIAGTPQYNQQQQQIQNYNQAGQQAVSGLQNQLGNLQQTTGLAANQMGQNQLLQNTFANPNYNVGQQTLDSLFLSGQDNQLKQNLGNIYNTANQQATGLGTDYQSKLAALNNLAGQNSAYAQNLFLNGPGGTGAGQGLNQIAGNVANEYANAAATAPGQYQQMQADLTKNKLSQADLSSLGIAPGTSTWGVNNLQNYLTQTPLSAANQGGNAQVATPQEFARYNALNQLAGGSAGALQPSIFGAATTAGNFTPYTFNNAKFNTDVNAAKQAITGTDLQNAVSGLSADAASNPLDARTDAAIQSSLKANPNMTADQINQIIKNSSQSIANSYDIGAPSSVVQQYANSLFSPWTSYYNNEYAPAANDILGAPQTTENSMPSGMNVNKGS